MDSLISSANAAYRARCDAAFLSFSARMGLTARNPRPPTANRYQVQELSMGSGGWISRGIWIGESLFLEVKTPGRRLGPLLLAEEVGAPGKYAPAGSGRLGPF